MQNKVKSSEINSTRVVLYLQKKPANLFKKRLCYRCFPMNFVKFLRTPIL